MVLRYSYRGWNYVCVSVTATCQSELDNTNIKLHILICYKYAPTIQITQFCITILFTHKRKSDETTSCGRMIAGINSVCKQNFVESKNYLFKCAKDHNS